MTRDQLQRSFVADEIEPAVTPEQYLDACSALLAKSSANEIAAAAMALMDQACVPLREQQSFARSLRSLGFDVRVP